jgi:SAM-dependent methyltransferase
MDLSNGKIIHDSVSVVLPSEGGRQPAAPRDLKAIYNRDFFLNQADGATRSARVVVPLIMKIVTDLRSVVDVGCGAGVWLAQFKEAGVPRVLGLDGGAAAEHHQLEIAPEEFRIVDLEQDIDKDQSFDLCICLEVAEHLAGHSAPALVRNVCKLSDVVLFSAAIPGQGAHHINERWPSYWVDLFASAGYEALDVVRGLIWNDARVEWWYRQNLLLFANKTGLARVARGAEVGSSPLDIVHPACFEHYRLIAERVPHGGSVELERRNADLQNRVQSILNSTSWKLTWPLRRLIGNNDRRRRRLRALARTGWLIASAKFLRRRGHIG